MRISPDQGLQFAQMLVQDEEPLADITQVRGDSGMRERREPPGGDGWELQEWGGGKAELNGKRGIREK